MKKSYVFLLSSLAIGAFASLVGTWVYFNNKSNARYKEISNFINSDLNNYSQENQVLNNEFVKGADISSYCEVIEEFLFQKNIKKPNGQWYRYDEIYSNYYNGQLLANYVNNNLFSYFDQNGNRKYDNLFAILKYYGLNSLRIRLWENPYDENGNKYGGGTNDLATALFIISEAKKYGFDDFLIIFHYSDFWADPHKQITPKQWQNLDDTQLLEQIYQYTKNCVEKISQVAGQDAKISFQLGNEISKGLLWKYENKVSKRRELNFEIDLLNQAIDAIKDFNNPNFKIGIGLDNCSDKGQIWKFTQWEPIIERIDTIYFSWYTMWSGNESFEKLYELLNELKRKWPDKEIIIGELAFAYNKDESVMINERHIASQTSLNAWDYNVDKQSKMIFDAMSIVSKIFKESRTGFYYWEPANILMGRNSWASKDGIEYLDKYIETSDYYDINNWSKLSLFDSNAIALPGLEVIRQFQRNFDINQVNRYKTEEIIKNPNSYSSVDKLIFNENNFLFEKKFNRLDLKNIFYSIYNNDLYHEEEYIDIYLNEIDNINNLREFIVNKLMFEYNHIMYEQLEFSQLNYDQDNKDATIELSAKANSYYYQGSIVFSFKIHDDYIQNTINLNNENNPIIIEMNDQFWYKKIINHLKKLENYQFANNIYQFLKVSGGANDDDSIWLWDENKQVNRNAEFFLLKDDKIRYQNNKVNYDVLNENKFWINTMNEFYSNGEHEIYFAIRKEINDMNLEYNINSTFSQVGMESWKYLDLLIYKIKIKIV